MEILAFRSAPPGPHSGRGDAAIPAGRKERLAVVSSSDRLCGIAAYTEALRRHEQRHKQVTAIVHNRRDAADLKYLYGIEQVLDHPLAFLSRAEVETVRTRGQRRAFPTLDLLPDDAVLIGVFGFLNDYKGFG